MRYQGKILDWKDDEGFGFVMPNGGGQKAFVHIKAFLRRSRRPITGDLITYEIAKDKKNRYYAKNIQFVGDSLNSPKHYNISLIPSYFATLFLILLFLFGLTKTLYTNPFLLYLCASIITFFIYWMDKSAAKKNNQRTPENTLHLLSLAGGWPGAIFAQKLLHHKSMKKEFQIVFWVTVILNISALIWLLIGDYVNT